MSSKLRKHLSAPGLIQAVHNVFKKIRDPREFKQEPGISLQDHLMSGLAVFGLKCSSLLEYDKKRKSPPIEINLQDLYHIETPPSDSYMRERLDEVDPKNLRPAFTKLFAYFQRGKGLEEYEYLDGAVLLSIDGTGHFSSGKVSCPYCCQKKHKGGSTTYYHQMLGASIVHPDRKCVIPLCPEAILNKDGVSKNDCEQNATKRFLENFRREHPHLKAIILADGLSSKAPNIRMIEKEGLQYILGAKPGDHEFLFEQLEANSKATYYEFKDDSGYHQFRFLNGVSLNKSNRDLQVNALEYRHTNLKGKELNFSWVTNIKISTTNAIKIARGGRARWKIENETFNTLKNLGYNFEHNYGHGKKYLSTVFCMLMMLTFLIDQIQEACCSLFQKCRTMVGTKRGLWQEILTLFRYVSLGSWENLYLILVREVQLVDTS